MAHSVTLLAGTNSWKTYTNTFLIDNATEGLKVKIELTRAQGILWARNISLHTAARNPVFQYGKYLFFSLGGILVAMVFLPYFKVTSKLFCKGMALALLIAILTGTLLPGKEKVTLLKETNKLYYLVVNTFKQPSSKSKEILKSPTKNYKTSTSGQERSHDLTKVAHFVLFCFFTFVLCLISSPTKPLTLLFNIFLLATTTEMLQFFIEGRSPLFMDIGIDMAGAISGLLLGFWMIKQKWGKPSSRLA